MNRSVTHSWKYEVEREQFLSRGENAKICAYFDIPSFHSGTLSILHHRRMERRLSTTLSHCRKINVGAILPRLADTDGLLDDEVDLLRNFYRTILKIAKENGIAVSFNFEKAYRDYLYRTLPEAESLPLRGKMLTMYETLCDREQTIHYALHGGTLMSIVAFDGDQIRKNTVDLREFIDETGNVVWTAPAYGNWHVLEFTCETDLSSLSTDFLSYDTSYTAIEKTFSLFSEVFPPYVGDTLSILEYHDISFDAPNRRTWSDDFNRVFEEEYGFDPAPYYPALFRDIGPDTDHLRSLFFTCRSKMAERGFFRAAHDFAKRHGLFLIGSLTEPKLSACPWITGDNLLLGKYASGALLDKAYLYGTNSLKIASSSAFNYDNDRATCELYRNYYRASEPIFYNDAMNALSRGINLLMVHIPILEAVELRNLLKNFFANHWESDFTGYVGRVQSLLCGGNTVSDIAMLYPIHSLAAGTNFYTSPVKRFEYPASPHSTDYMTLLNTALIYAGHDVTLLHPETMLQHCTVENGALKMETAKSSAEFKILILPATKIMSLEALEMAAKFFDEGGKIISTGVLPSEAFEYTPETSKERDKHVCELVTHIFGKESCDPKIIRPFFYHANEQGGEAYFIPFSLTAADATATTKCRHISDAIHSFELPLDVYMPQMPKIECIGALNNIYPEFEALGLIHRIPGGGLIGHIHKKRGAADIYYFTNTTDTVFDSPILLRGRLSPVEWIPATGRTRPLPFSTVTYLDTVYTKIDVTIPQSKSILIVSDPHHVEAFSYKDVLVGDDSSSHTEDQR